MTGERMTPRAVRDIARTHGLASARVRDLDRLGRRCVVDTPWHPEPVVIADELDVQWLLVELGNTGHPVADPLAA